MKDIIANSYYEPPGEWVTRNDEIQAMNKLCRFQRYKNNCVVTGTIKEQLSEESKILEMIIKTELSIMDSAVRIAIGESQ